MARLLILLALYVAIVCVRAAVLKHVPALSVFEKDSVRYGNTITVGNVRPSHVGVNTSAYEDQSFNFSFTLVPSNFVVYGMWPVGPSCGEGEISTTVYDQFRFTVAAESLNSYSVQAAGDSNYGDRLTCNHLVKAPNCKPNLVSCVWPGGVAWANFTFRVC